jgi:hypothetical protein
VLKCEAKTQGGKIVKSARREDAFMDEIVKALKTVPKARLRIVRDVVGALAAPSVRDKNELKRREKKAFSELPFVGFGKGGRTSVMVHPTRER